MAPAAAASAAPSTSGRCAAAGGRAAAAMSARVAAAGVRPAAAAARRALRAAAASSPLAAAAAPRRRGAAAARAGEQPPPSTAAAAAGPAGAFAPGPAAADARRDLFNAIAPVYDELNNRLSFGQHWVWKAMAIKWAAPRPGQRALDVCCGSGDLAYLLARAVGPAGSVVGLDFAAAMLTDARRRASEMQPAGGRPAAAVEWTQGDAMALPFPDASFDAATMGYGLRNVADIDAALRELARVLRPGSSAALLDFNNSSDPLVDGAQAWVLSNIVVPAARQYGLGEEYEYLRPSIKRFPSGPQQEAAARAAGFSRAIHYEVGFGLMGILVATK